MTTQAVDYYNSINEVLQRAGYQLSMANRHNDSVSTYESLQSINYTLGRAVGSMRVAQYHQAKHEVMVCIDALQQVIDRHPTLTTCNHKDDEQLLPILRGVRELARDAKGMLGVLAP